MGKKSRDIGVRFEQKVARLLRPVFPDVVTTRSMQSRQGSVLAADLANTGNLVIECKDHWEGDVTPAWQQAAAVKAPAGSFPVAVTHGKGRRSIQVTMKFHHLDALLHPERITRPESPLVTLDWDDWYLIVAERYAARPAARQMCMECDGVGWVEGGSTLKTRCMTCQGSGEV